MENPIKDNRIVNDKTFALRFHSFVENTQVNDLMSEEEKEYLLHVADKLIKYQAETVSTKAEADYLTNNNISHSWREEKCEEKSEEKVVVGNSFKVNEDGLVAGIEDRCKPRNIIKTSDFVAGDIVLWDGEEKIVVDGEKNFVNVFPKDVFTPIGVVVIPASHMDDGKARMMSTRWMSCNDPENGSFDPERMVWGNDANVNRFTKFSQVPINKFTYKNMISGTNEYGYLSSNYWEYSGKHNPNDIESDWFYEYDDFRIPSPYAKDGTSNPLYRAMSYSGGSINNPLSCFDGRHLTDVILEARGTKDYGSWRPKLDNPEDFPAASCCDMYHTVGTSKGEWYLPSIAELGYVVARLRDINNSMTKINDMLLLSFWAWSSTEFAESYVYYIAFYNGLVSYMNYKNKDFCSVVAFATV